jgi:hypothetical protein
MRRASAWRRAAAAVVVFLGVPAFILTSCPSNRDGMPGQLASAKEETVAAARSGALALQLWTQHRSTRQLTCVQLADARDEMVKAFQGIAVLKAEDRVDIGRQRVLTDAMTALIGDLNSANAAVRGMPAQHDPGEFRQRLLDGAERLDRDYR